MINQMRLSVVVALGTFPSSVFLVRLGSLGWTSSHESSTPLSFQRSTAKQVCGLRWAKSRDSYRRIASESYRCDSNRKSHLPPETQKLVLTDPAFVVLRFESRDWRSFVEHFVPRGTAEWLARLGCVR